MTYAFFLVYLTRYGFLVVAEYAGELSFWLPGPVITAPWTRSMHGHTEWAASL